MERSETQSARPTASPETDAETTHTRKDREREQRRRDVLDAALILFSQKGYEGTTMAEIAEAAEFAVGTLYKFFKDKHDLYQTLVAETMHDFEQQLTIALQSPPDDELVQINRYIEIGAALFVKHLPLSRVYFSQTGAAFLYVTVGLEAEAFLSYGRIVTALKETFRRGIAKGVFIDIDPGILAMCLEGVHNSFLAALVRDENSFSVAQIAEYTKRVFFGPVLRSPTGS